MNNGYLNCDFSDSVNWITKKSPVSKMKIKGKCHNWNCFFDFSLSKETLVEQIASFLKQSTAFRSIIISVLLFKLCFANSNWFRQVFPWWRRAQLEKLVLLSFRRQKRRRMVLHVAIEFFYDHFSVPIHENISSRFFLREPGEKKRGIFALEIEKHTSERKGKDKKKKQGGRVEKKRKKSNGCTLSLYIGYFGLTEEVYLAERFQESARFRQVVISLLKKLTKSKGGSRKITSRHFGSNIPWTREKQRKHLRFVTL